MGRPPKSDFSRKSKGIRIRLTPAEYAWIKVVAQENGETMREVLWDAFQKKTQNMDPDKFSELSIKVVEEMKKK